MNWPIQSPNRGVPRPLVRGLIGLAICQFLSAPAGATQIFSRFVDQAVEQVSLAQELSADQPLDASQAGSAAADLIDENELPSAYQAIGGREVGGEDEARLGPIAPAAWLGAIVNLVAADSGPFDLSSNPVVAAHALGATLHAFEAFGDLSWGDSTDWEEMMRLSQKPSRPDGYIMHEVTAALEDFATPEPDFLFLVFLMAQSVWALASRPRTA